MDLHAQLQQLLQLASSPAGLAALQQQQQQRLPQQPPQVQPQAAAPATASLQQQQQQLLAALLQASTAAPDWSMLLGRATAVPAITPFQMPASAPPSQQDLLIQTLIKSGTPLQQLCQVFSLEAVRHALLPAAAASAMPAAVPQLNAASLLLQAALPSLSTDLTRALHQQQQQSISANTSGNQPAAGHPGSLLSLFPNASSTAAPRLGAPQQNLPPQTTVPSVQQPPSHAVPVASTVSAKDNQQVTPAAGTSRQRVQSAPAPKSTQPPSKPAPAQKPPLVPAKATTVADKSRDGDVIMRPASSSQEPHEKREPVTEPAAEPSDDMVLETGRDFNLRVVDGTWTTATVTARTATPVPRPSSAALTAASPGDMEIPGLDADQQLPRPPTPRLPTSVKTPPHDSDSAPSAPSGPVSSTRKPFGAMHSKPLVFDLSSDDEAKSSRTSSHRKKPGKTASPPKQGAYAADAAPDVHHSAQAAAAAAQAELDRKKLLAQLKLREFETLKMKTKIAVMEARARGARALDDSSSGASTPRSSPSVTTGNSEPPSVPPPTDTQHEQQALEPGQLADVSQPLPSTPEAARGELTAITEELIQLSLHDDVATSQMTNLQARIDRMQDAVRKRQAHIASWQSQLAAQADMHARASARLNALRSRENELRKYLDTVTRTPPKQDARQPPATQDYVAPRPSKPTEVIDLTDEPEEEAQKFLDELTVPDVAPATDAFTQELGLHEVNAPKSQSVAKLSKKARKKARAKALLAQTRNAASEADNVAPTPPPSSAIEPVSSPVASSSISVASATDSAAAVAVAGTKRPASVAVEADVAKKQKYSAQEMAELLKKLDLLQQQQRKLKTQRISPLAQRAIDRLNTMPRSTEPPTKDAAAALLSTRRLSILYCFEYTSAGKLAFMLSTSDNLCRPSAATRIGHAPDTSALQSDLTALAYSLGRLAPSTTMTTTRTTKSRTPTATYRSPLSMLRSYRLTAHAQGDVPARKQVTLDCTDIQLCIYELQGGICRIPDCKDTHLSQLEKTDEETVMELLTFEDGVPSDKLSEFRTSLIKQLELIPVTAPSERVLQVVNTHRFKWFGNKWVPSGRRDTSSTAQSAAPEESGPLAQLPAAQRDQYKIPRRVPVFLQGLERLLNGRPKATRYWEAPMGVEVCEAAVKADPKNELLWLRYAIECLPDHPSPTLLADSSKINKSLSVLAAALETLPQSYNLWRLYLELSLRRNSEDEVRTDFENCLQRVSDVGVIYWLYISWEPELPRRHLLYETWLQQLVQTNTSNSRIIVDVLLNRLYDGHVAEQHEQTSAYLWKFLTATPQTMESFASTTPATSANLRSARCADLLDATDVWLLWSVYLYLAQYEDLPTRHLIFGDGPHRYLSRKRFYLIHWPADVKPHVYTVSEALRTQWVQRFSPSTQEHRVCFAAVLHSHVAIMIAIGKPVFDIMKVTSLCQMKYPTHVEFCHLHLQALSTLKYTGFPQALDSCLARFPDDQGVWNVALAHALANEGEEGMFKAVVRYGYAGFETTPDTTNADRAKLLDAVVGLLGYRLGTSFTPPAHPGTLRTHVKAGADANNLLSWLNFGVAWLLSAHLCGTQRPGLLQLLERGKDELLAAEDRAMLLSEIAALIAQCDRSHPLLVRLVSRAADRLVSYRKHPQAGEHLEMSFMDVTPVMDCDILVNVLLNVKQSCDPALFRKLLDAINISSSSALRFLFEKGKALLGSESQFDQHRGRVILEQQLLTEPDNAQLWTLFAAIAEPQV
ncbi:Zinc finger C3H1 domain-containing protein [Sorochytrium milnesiophthora]